MRAATVLLLALIDVHTLVVRSQGITRIAFNWSTSIRGSLSSRWTTHQSGTTATTIVVEYVTQGTSTLKGTCLIDALVAATTGKKAGTLIHIQAT